MQKFKIKIKASLTILTLFLVPVIVKAIVVIRPAVLLELKSYNTFVWFEKEMSLSKIVVESDKIYLNHIWFKLSGANITFKKFFENNQLVFSLSGSGLAHVEFFSPQKPIKVSINGTEEPEGEQWFYNSTSKTVMIVYNL